MKNESTRQRRNGRARALLSLGMLIGIAQVGTLAAWTDAATVDTGSFTTGNLDVMVGEDSAGQLGGQGGSWEHPTLSLSGMAPGESVARLLTVGNGGSIPLSLTGTVATSNGALSGDDGLQVTVVQGATGVSNTGSIADNNRTGSCTGGSATSVTNTAVGTTAVSLHDSAVALAPDATKTYCVVAKLSAAAPNSMQGKSTSLTFSFGAEQ